MTSWKKHLKSALRKTPLFKPLKYMAAIFGRSTYPLPFSHTESAAPFLDRAIARIGNLPLTERNSHNFYSYFSEIWDQNYESGLNEQYASYLPLLRALPEGQFLDIGCGAGEFIYYLNQNHIPAEGIDQDIKEVERATRRGLSVFCDSAESHLKESRKKYSGISLLEVIEHISPDGIPPLLSIIFEKLMPGGAVLIETINIKHPLAFHSFYTDPTHQRPVPSDLLVFMLQWHGFVDAQVIYTNPLAFSLSESSDPTRAYFNYAVIAKKPDHSTKIK
ncbi:MAG: class I SAM-dependent methyltransferase [Acidithiobacillus ferriphilus]|uniref:class I SAM-dependent methyltransferase n=1 Tax=Acidithiobacillus ferriphilus TaxID=1689834 RepID=UPI001C063015|nr:class I SAM-dependent methyltransferase [Acidithiobacillus ferriphilus]MBU2785957.1 class I SAM-dependent methyltransferase [Acidithiobacillus ferriphilus]MBU2826752.1 class I SAM-dependent methyltransferase [Acidithiobacillus ferriphilus]MBU2844789.1 class I SAM-dependent methyltransferase [Acidithiobacillus ferriphilus]MBU2848692.1 class I SAM-dependent methyltransferase [Acidithiobacillus ferriphilus]MEB8475989.1 class I SAM-dependent methyltransferase [Acidithiobacillus ferriphilus]